MENAANNNTKWLWPVMFGALGVFGMVYFSRKKKRQDEFLAQAQEEVALVVGNHGETAENMGNNSNMAELAQQFFNAFDITRVMGKWIVGNYLTSTGERQILYDLAALCTNYKELILYFNKLTGNELTFADALSRSDVSIEGKNNILKLLKVQKVVDNSNGRSMGAYVGTAQNGMVQTAQFEANTWSADDWNDDRELYNINNVTIVNPIN